MGENLQIKSPEEIFAENAIKIDYSNSAVSLVAIGYKILAVGVISLAIYYIIKVKDNQIKINNYENTNSK